MLSVLGVALFIFSPLSLKPRPPGRWALGDEDCSGGPTRQDTSGAPPAAPPGAWEPAAGSASAAAARSASHRPLRPFPDGARPVQLLLTDLRVRLAAADHHISLVVTVCLKDGNTVAFKMVWH